MPGQLEKVIFLSYLIVGENVTRERECKSSDSKHYSFLYCAVRSKTQTNNPPPPSPKPRSNGKCSYRKLDRKLNICLKRSKSTMCIKNTQKQKHLHLIVTVVFIWLAFTVANRMDPIYSLEKSNSKWYNAVKNSVTSPKLFASSTRTRWHKETESSICYHS